MSALSRLMMLVSITVVCCVTSNALLAQGNAYQRGEGSFVNLPAGRQWGAVSAIHYAGNDAVWIAERCGGNRGPESCEDLTSVDPIMLVDTQGNILKSFGAGLFVWPHGIFVDHDNNLWVTDAAASVERGIGNQVHKFSPDGELLMSLGTAGVAGNGRYVFNAPNDVLVAPNGDIFVSDGHNASVHNRVVKYNSAGEYLLEWGRVGAEAGEFRVPHALAMDSQGRLFVADRGNSRLQIFDQEGSHLQTWTQFGRPSDLYIDSSDVLYSADSESNTAPDRNPGWRRGFYIGSALDGFVTTFVEDPNINPSGTTSHAEGVTVDEEGNLYAAEVAERNVRKFTLIP